MQSRWPSGHASRGGSLSNLIDLGGGRRIALVEHLGSGACGSVWRGLLENRWGVHRPVAVKVFGLDPHANEDEALALLTQVMRTLVCVNHPSVVQVFELSRAPRRPDSIHPSPCIVTELVEGESLASILAAWHERGLRPPVDFATVVTLRAAEALSAALFAEGPDASPSSLVHGQLSSRQIILSSSGDVKVTDFGQNGLHALISHVRSRDHLAYAAPEIAAGERPSAVSDVFALGMLLHEMLLGPRFAPGTTFAEAAWMARQGTIHLSVLAPNPSSGLREILARSVAPDPMDRYPHAHAFAQELRREIHRLGLCDARTCVRHAVVGWCEVR